MFAISEWLWCRSCLVGVILAAVVCGGCDNSLRPVPVSGTVFIDDKPLTKGYVRFINQIGRGANGSINSDGTFRLSTFADGDGCLPGQQQVEIIAFEAVGPASQRWLVPKEYNNAGTSGLTFDVTGPTIDARLELTWKTSKAGHTKPYVDGGQNE